MKNMTLFHNFRQSGLPRYVWGLLVGIAGWLGGGEMRPVLAQPPGSCCVSADFGGEPFCEDPACVACVQQHAPETECTPGFWPLQCRILAMDVCGTECGCVAPEPSPLLSCCETNSKAGGCVEPVCMECVCATDPYCCETAWDPGCAAKAASVCQGVCGCGSVAFGGQSTCPFPNPCVGPKVPVANGTCQPAPVGAPVGAGSCPLALYDFATCGVGPNVRFVLQSAPPGGTGTQAQPFQTINQGLAAVPPGGTVCVGRGIYPEFVLIQKPVRVIGTCPKLTRVTSGGFLIQATQQVELQGMTISHTDSAGVAVFGATFVALRRLLIEHNPIANVWIEQSLTGNLLGPLPSKCGCGQQHNIDMCLTTLQFSGGAGAGVDGMIVDDIRILLSLVSRNGAGLRLEQDALQILGSVLSGNQSGLISRNPQENVEIFNSRVQRNTKLGLGFTATSPLAPKVFVHLSNNDYTTNYGSALVLLNDTPVTDLLSVAVTGSVFSTNKSAGIYTSRVPVTVLSSTVSGTVAGTNPGRGIEVLLTDSVRVQSSTVSGNADVGILVGLLDSEVALAHALIDGNTVKDNGYYGMSLQPFFVGAEPLCPASSSVPGAATVSVTNNTVTGNVGAGISLSTFDYRALFLGNVVSETKVGVVGDPASTANYGVTAACSSFNLSSGTVGFQGTPTAVVLVESAKTKLAAPSVVGDGMTLTPPVVDSNDPVLTNLLVSPKFTVQTGVNLPMPCPLLPTDPVAALALLNSL